MTAATVCYGDLFPLSGSLKRTEVDLVSGYSTSNRCSWDIWTGSQCAPGGTQTPAPPPPSHCSCLGSGALVERGEEGRCLGADWGALGTSQDIPRALIGSGIPRKRPTSVLFKQAAGRGKEFPETQCSSSQAEVIILPGGPRLWPGLLSILNKLYHNTFIVLK